ncbi:class I SAM-dependent methyltransferase [Streptomyces sp. NPDC000405]|uniref:class I SAM-dependent methyltransferase n=1 Tax=Streptomyces sp. NPDC000405 TaxID=3161033 RepID=UPI00398D1C0C
MIDNPTAYWEDLWAGGRRYRQLTDSETAALGRHTGPGEGRSALDIGSSDGALARHLADRGFKTTGLDCAPSALALASTGPSSNVVTFCHGDIESPQPPPLPESAFAVVTARLVYAFVKDKPAFLSRVRGLLVPGGLFWVVTPMAARVPAGQVSNGITTAEEELLTSGWSAVRATDMDYLRCFALRP